MWLMKEPCSKAKIGPVLSVLQTVAGDTCVVLVAAAWPARGLSFEVIHWGELVSCDVVKPSV